MVGKPVIDIRTEPLKGRNFVPLDMEINNHTIKNSYHQQIKDEHYWL